MIEAQLKAIRQRITVGMESRADVQALADEAMRLRFGLGELKDVVATMGQCSACMDAGRTCNVPKVLTAIRNLLGE